MPWRALRAGRVGRADAGSPRGKPEVGRLRDAVRTAHKDVRGRHVAVNHALIVRVRQRVTNLGDDVDGLAQREPPASLQQLAGVESVRELHDDEVTRLHPSIQNGDDVRVREMCPQPCFMSEALHEPRVGCEALGDELDRHLARQQLVVSAGDDGHPTRSDPSEQVIPVLNQAIRSNGRRASTVAIQPTPH